MDRDNTAQGSSASEASPAVSVVVPSYNHAPFIQSTLRSIFNQTLAPKRLLVIDDGSTDGSPQVIDSILPECPFPSELIVGPNRGLCTVLNEGLRQTRGKYFAYLSSDDLWLPEFLEQRVKRLEETPQAVLGYGHCFLIDSQNTIFDCTRDWAVYTNGNVRRMLLQETFAPMSPTVLYRRSALEQEGWDEQAKLEDYDLYLRLSTRGDFAFDNQILSAWRQHVGNTSRDFVWMIEARLAAQRRVADRLGLSVNELERFQSRLKFEGADDLCRLGEKAAAINLMRQGFGGAPSLASRLRFLARVCAPNSLMRWRKQRRQAEAVARYGQLIL